MILAFVAVWMSLIAGFSAGRMVYDPTINKPLKIERVSNVMRPTLDVMPSIVSLDTVYSVADTKINTEK